MKVLGWITALIGLFIFGPIWSGYVLSLLWAWFIAPTFHISFLSIPLAIGISLVVRMFTYQMPDEKDSKNIDATKALLRSMGWTFFYPAFGLLFGYIVHLFI